MEKYDLAIIGAGPAGLNAAIYGARYGLKAIVIGGITGGLASTTHEIGNWLGTEKITGWDLAQNMVKHVKSYNTPIIERMVTGISKDGDTFRVEIAGVEPVEAKAILLAMGTSHRSLGVAGEKQFMGKGISYCATCDGFFYKRKTVAVVGGNDAAAMAASYLGDIAAKVYLIYRKNELQAEHVWQEAIAKNPKIEIVYNTVITEIKGEAKVGSVVVENTNGEKSEIITDGVFIEIGSEPNTDLLKDLGVETDDQGFVKIKAGGETTADGVWAAGDLTDGSNKFRQIITAAAEGAIATVSIQKYLKQKK